MTKPLPVYVKLFIQNLLQFVHKSVDVLELPVYGSKPYISHRLQLLQLIHNDLADDRAWNLLLLPVEDLCLHRIHQIINLVGRNRTLMAGPQHAGLTLGTVILLPDIILLDNNQRYRLHLLIGGEALAAFIAQPSTADGIIIICRSGINHPRIIAAAKGTLHMRFLPFLYNFQLYLPLINMIWIY